MTDAEEGSEEIPRSGYWTRLKKKWNRKGVVEIDVDHHRYDMLECIREGLHDLLCDHPELGPKDELTDEDYSHVIEKEITSPNGKTFKFASYASSVFATVRRAIDLPEDVFQKSISPRRGPYLEFISNSKSGQDFYLSNDKMYFIKTDKEYYTNYLLSILGDYLDHFLNYPHSLIVKYLGLFSVRIPGEGVKFFYIMQSIFYPDERIETRYDVKGALAGRYQKPPEVGSDVITILKDENFVQLDESLDLGGQRDWFVKQLTIDAEFMRELGVQDYSLLIGYHKLQSGERQKGMADIVLRVKKSVPVKSGSSTPTSAKIGGAPFESLEMKKMGNSSGSTDGVDNPGVDDEGRHNNNSNNNANGDAATSPQARDDAVTDIGGTADVGGASGIGTDTDVDGAAAAAAAQPARKLRKRPTMKLGAVHLNLIKAETLDHFGGQNRRLLPSGKNQLHILDGRENRYYIGIIDFFTLYECRQRMGRVLKNVKFRCGEHSTVPPARYAERFVAFVADHTV